jgi:hypothetical protein
LYYHLLHKSDQAAYFCRSDTIPVGMHSRVLQKNIPLVYYAFDLLSLEGTDVRDQPLLGRRKLLARLLKNGSRQYPLLRGAAGDQRGATGNRT